MTTIKLGNKVKMEYLHQLVAMATNQFVRRNGSQALELVICNHVVSSSKCSCRVIRNTLPNFALSVQASSRRGDGHYFMRKGLEMTGQSKQTRKQPFHPSPHAVFCLFESVASQSKGLLFIPLIQAYFSLLYLVAIFTQQKKKKKCK